MTDASKPTGRSRRPRSEAPTTPDPVEIAMEVEASGIAPTGEASALLRRQTVLIDEQIGLARNERFRNRVIIAVVLALIVAVGAVVWSASRTTGLVIQPFSVPPELVEDGLDGRAVAALFQDELVRLEAATDSVRPAASFRNDWSEGITVEVEAGGLSLTDAYTALTRWLGQETYVSGGMRQTTSGLELVVRGIDGTAVTVQGPADQPEALMRQAAERVYEQTQPYRYATYLGDRAAPLPVGPERQALYDRRRAILTELLSNPSEIERAWGYNGLARSGETSARDAISLLQAGLEIDAEHPVLGISLITFNTLLGQSEAAVLAAKRSALSLSSRRNLAKINPDRRDRLRLQGEATLADFQGDFLRALEIRADAAFEPLTPTAFRTDAQGRVELLIALHQPSLGLTLNDSLALEDLREGYRLTRPLYLPVAEATASLDQWPQAVAALEAWEAERAATLFPGIRSARQTYLWPKLAYARARTGDLAGAQTLIAATAVDCYNCVRERARIAELAGDRAAADRWSAEARRQGPSLPFAFAERGQMLMARGDPAGAIAFYAQAVERGPRWADPQKYWGDALMAQGDEAGAIRKYRAAVDRAPQWGALHLAWGRALEADGKRDQARDRYTEAARMDLSAADRAEVVRRLAAVGRGS